MIKRIFWSVIVFITFTMLLSVSLPAAENGALEIKNSQFSLYKIGKGDILKILVWKEPDLSVESAMVRLDGKITLPLVDDVQAEGLSTMELKKNIEAALGKFVEAPLVTVILQDPSSQKFYILGEIEKIGEYPITKKMTLMQAFTVAGGFTEWAAKSEIILFRIVDGQEKIMRMNYKDIIRGKDFKYNVTIQADDVIIIP